MDQPAQELLPRTVMAFAASDPSGGGGLQADILTVASMGCHPLSVITAIGVRDTAEVSALMAVDPDWVADQARAILEDVPVAAFKIGMLPSIECVAVVAEVLSDYPEVPLILEAVLDTGDDFGSEEFIDATRELLLPQTTLLIANSLDARRLAEHGGEDDEPDLAECARRLVEAGAEFVLITGTHENTLEVVNTLYGAQGQLRADAWERLPGSYLGSGTTLSAAVAAGLANGLDLPDAVRDAQEYTWQALANGFRPGMGQIVPDRFFWARDEDDEKQGA
jgi:hydroxymethylpyrimidine/phosphomethylpyrimidine kinase